MRKDALLLSLASLAVASVLASSAFNAASLGTRSVTATVSNDNVGYLALERNGLSPHKCHVTGTSTAKVAVSFAGNGGCSGAGGGSGISEASWYEFDDLLNITNLGTRSTYVFVNATSTAGTVKVAVKTTTGAMRDGDYSATPTGTTGQLLAVGSKLYVGVRVEAGTVQSGSSVSGAITVSGTHR